MLHHRHQIDHPSHHRLSFFLISLDLLANLRATSLGNEIEVRTKRKNEDENQDGSEFRMEANLCNIWRQAKLV